MGLALALGLGLGQRCLGVVGAAGAAGAAVPESYLRVDVDMKFMHLLPAPKSIYVCAYKYMQSPPYPQADFSGRVSV
ncbi:uncharacterized protein Dana_GF26504 [Drosophila ananassae]|uniref:Uncharacterized protein n=1 Tax=Drosophila ananassae TaxID=7217 RepID=A0A0P8XUX0_DROAN|nr:uncharacterized protein Dana_GF26504 [Drosophila ananassae]